MGWIAIALLLLVVWVVGMLVFKVASFLFHLLLVAAVVAAAIYLMQRTRTRRSTA